MIFDIEGLFQVTPTTNSDYLLYFLTLLHPQKNVTKKLLGKQYDFSYDNLVSKKGVVDREGRHRLRTKQEEAQGKKNYYCDERTLRKLEKVIYDLNHIDGRLAKYPKILPAIQLCKVFFLCCAVDYLDTYFNFHADIGDYFLANCFTKQNKKIGDTLNSVTSMSFPAFKKALDVLAENDIISYKVKRTGEDRGYYFTIIGEKDVFIE